MKKKYALALLDQRAQERDALHVQIDRLQQDLSAERSFRSALERALTQSAITAKLEGDTFRPAARHTVIAALARGLRQ